MAIPDSFIAQLKSSSDIENIISSYVNLKRSGRHKSCVCPFHSEKTPSMYIYPETQSFYCFGCGTGGDVITFLMKIENLEYIEAIKSLAKRVGLEVPDTDYEDKTHKLKITNLEINRETAKFFHSNLKSEQGKTALKYLRDRGLSDKTILKYGLGYAPNSWDSLIKYLKQKGFSIEQMYSSGVITKGKNNSYYDQFRNRVMFPIIDLRGNVIAFGGRVLDDSKPKYLNSGDTPIFKKSKNLFSLNFAKNNIDAKLILAEGYMDVIAIYQAGFKNVVATLGTALTSEQARLISQYTNQVIIAYDSDSAGQIATHRAINLLSEVGVNSKIINMQGAKDPDEFIKKYGELRFKMLLDGANNAFEYEFIKLKQQYNIEIDSEKIEYLKKATNIISDIKNSLEREVYAGKVSNETGVLKETILSSVEKTIKSRQNYNYKKQWKEIETGRERFQDKINPQRGKNIKQATAEEGIIAFLFKNQDIFKNINDKVNPEDFVTEFNKKVFEFMCLKNGDGFNLDLSLFLNEFSQDEIGKISGIIAKNIDLGNNLNQFEDYVKVLKDYKQKIKVVDVANMDLEQLVEYQNKIKQQKLNKK